MKVKFKHFIALQEVYKTKLPRKIKKAILGDRISSNELNRKLRSVKLIKDTNTMYDRPEFTHEAFCQNCGCTAYFGIDHEVEYPEHWEDFYCMRCKSKVAVIDNSPFIHVLTMPGFSFGFPY